MKRCGLLTKRVMLVKIGPLKSINAVLSVVNRFSDQEKLKINILTSRLPI